MTTAYVTDRRFAEHDFPRHPENASRIKAVWAKLDQLSLGGELVNLSPTAASDEQILAVHSQNLLKRLVNVSRQDRMARIDHDTYALPVSLEIARLAAGAVIEAVDAVLTGAVGNAMAIVRPPGHHAMPDRSMGFCLLNNIAIGARHARDYHKLRRVLIIDYDVHHGNGTQDIFYDDASTMFLSIHQSPYYPGTGHMAETGTGAGHGHTMNIPISSGHGDESYRQIFQHLVLPSAEKFAPDLLLISAGFDAHWVDPLAGMRLSLSGFDWLSRQCIHLAEKFCDGKIVMIMEGGYDLDALAHGWSNIAAALLGMDRFSDPYGEAPSAKSPRELKPLLDKLRQLHGL